MSFGAATDAIYHLHSWGHEVSLSLAGFADTCVRKDSESASSSPSASLVLFERRSSSCRVIQAGILVSYANISKGKGALSLFEGCFFNDLSNQISFCFPFSSADGAKAWTGTYFWYFWLLCLVGGLVVLLQVWSSRPGANGWVVVGCAAKANFSSFKSLREAIVTCHHLLRGRRCYMTCL